MDLRPAITEIIALEVELHKPEVRRSGEALHQLLAEQFFEFGSSGTVYDRATTIELLLQETDEAEGQLQTENYELHRISEDAVLLTYQSRRLFDDGSDRRVLRSSIWKHDGLRWRMLFHQGTVKP